MSDYYAALGVKKNASDKEIKTAFRRLARKHHPDLNPGDEKAEREFKKINEAYEVLSDSDGRKKYDRYGDDWKQADRIESQRGPFTYSSGGRSGRSGDLFDFLSGYGGGGGGGGFGQTGHARPRVQSLETSVELSLEEAFAGTLRQVTLSEPGGPRRMEVKIPAGVKTGSKVRISPSPGLEVLIRVTVQPHRRYKRAGDGQDLEVEVEVPFEVAALGGEAAVSTMTGRVVLKIPAASPNGRRIRLAGKGMPVLGSPDRRGDLFAIVRPSVPSDLTDEQREILQEYQRSRAAGVAHNTDNTDGAEGGGE